MEKNPTAKGSFAELLRWAKNQIVADVPRDLELCEFDCRKHQCALNEWANCERRLNRAAGELMPLPR